MIRWVNCKERKPTEDGKYVVFWKEEIIWGDTTYKYSGKSILYFHDGMFYDKDKPVKTYSEGFKVTHWLELDDPEEEE